MTTMHATTSPDWALIPFEVHCARCGEDLHGLIDPVCPACHLEFDWSVAVPIEYLTCARCDYRLYGLTKTRCPECGTDFTWDKALEHYRQKGKLLFEYRWRQQPVRSFVRTWIATLMPRRFWSRLDMHDPPEVAPLLWFVLVSSCLFLASLVNLEGIHDWSWQAGRSVRWNGVFDWATVPQIPAYWLRAVQRPRPFLTVEHALLWWCSTLLALSVFQQSMRRCKLRTVHVVRITAYAQFSVLSLATTSGLVVMVLEAFGVLSWRVNGERWVILCAAVFVVWSLRCGYAHYAKMKHATAVAISSQMIALMTVDMVSGWIHGKDFGGRLLLGACRVLGIPL